MTVFLLWASLIPVFALNLKFTSQRNAFYRDESPSLGVEVEGTLPEDAILEAKLGEYLIQSKPASSTTAIHIPARLFRSGEYKLTARLLDSKGEEVAIKSFPIQLVKRPGNDRLQNWLWMNGGPIYPEFSFYKEHGFDFVGGPMLP
ncbi:MAG TPA: hypothetical protein PLS03_17520, partial [Terrimicrobiaceae bacterium]|nr:hypothetical protein [Terrimicrobiaceae bacterium]